MSLHGPMPRRRLAVEELLGREFPPRLPVRLLGVLISSFEGETRAGGREGRDAIVVGALTQVAGYRVIR
jgi:hypothetical protein